MYLMLLYFYAEKKWNDFPRSLHTHAHCTYAYISAY